MISAEYEMLPILWLLTDSGLGSSWGKLRISLQSSSSCVSSEKVGTMEERQTPKITSPALGEACPVIKSKKQNKKKPLDWQGLVFSGRC